jgi:hypothetical protein
MSEIKEKKTWCATAKAYALKHGDFIAPLPEPLAMHLQMEPGTDGYGGKWEPIKTAPCQFPDQQRIDRALRGAGAYPFELDRHSICVHSRTEVTTASYDPPLPLHSQGEAK